MDLPNAIIDTSVLIALHHLGIWKCLNLLYNKIHIPRAVEQEFLRPKNLDLSKQSEYYKFIEQLYELPWVQACSDYDSSIVDLYATKPGIHKGESEAFAQWQALGNMPEVLVDDKKARNLAHIEKIKHHGTLYLLAQMDIRLKCVNYYKATDKLRNELKFRITDKTIHKVYNKVKSYY